MNVRSFFIKLIYILIVVRITAWVWTRDHVVTHVPSTSYTCVWQVAHVTRDTRISSTFVRQL